MTIFTTSSFAHLSLPSRFVKDALTLQYIDKADVEIIGTDGTSYKTKTDIKGYYHFDKTMILSNVTYKMRVTKSKYWEENNTASQTTVGLTENTDLKQDFLLTPTLLNLLFCLRFFILLMKLSFYLNIKIHLCLFMKL